MMRQLDELLACATGYSHIQQSIREWWNRNVRELYQESIIHNEQVNQFRDRNNFNQYRKWENRQAASAIGQTLLDEKMILVKREFVTRKSELYNRYNLDDEHTRRLLLVIKP